MAKDALTAHFSPKKNLTADRYRFFCTKPTSPEESHDHWITRLRIKGKDCEFENMNVDEAIKLVVTLHTPSEKLQPEIIAKNMDLKMVTDSARALELTQRELRFMKNTSIDPDAPEINSVSEQQFESKGRTTAPFRPDIDEQPARNKSTVEVCRYCGQQTPHRGTCKAREATCNKCKKKELFASQTSSDNGTPYNSEQFKQYAKYMGFKHTKKIPYTPWANGTAENFMRNLGN